MPALIPFAVMLGIIGLIALAWFTRPVQEDMCKFYRDSRKSEQEALQMCEVNDSCHTVPDDYRYLEWLEEKEEATCGYVDQ